MTTMYILTIIHNRPGSIDNLESSMFTGLYDTKDKAIDAMIKNNQEYLKDLLDDEEITKESEEYKKFKKDCKKRPMKMDFHGWRCHIYKSKINHRPQEWGI